ncbi:MAG: hypothetical protein RR036_01280 [Oscillospiraceae bacterium]
MTLLIFLWLLSTPFKKLAFNTQKRNPSYDKEQSKKSKSTYYFALYHILSADDKVN